MQDLRDLGNTLLVVEHDEDTMRAADYIIDVGPGAGVHGGEIVAAGTPEEVMNTPGSITGDYLSGRKGSPSPPSAARAAGTSSPSGARRRKNGVSRSRIDFHSKYASPRSQRRNAVSHKVLFASFFFQEKGREFVEAQLQAADSLLTAQDVADLHAPPGVTDFPAAAMRTGT